MAKRGKGLRAAGAAGAAVQGSVLLAKGYATTTVVGVALGALVAVVSVALFLSGKGAAFEIPEVAKGERKLPFVVMQVRGRVEYLDEEAGGWKRLESGQVLWEGARINVGDGGSMTMYSDGNASITADRDAMFAIGRGRMRGGKFDIDLKLDSGRVVARVDEGDSNVTVSTDRGTYTFSGGSSASVATGISGDEVAVVSGRVDAALADGSQRTIGERQGATFGDAAGGFAEGPLANPADSFASVSVHVNTVGNEAGDQPDQLDLEAERKKLQDLIWWGMERMRNRDFTALFGQLGSGFVIQGIPAGAASFGGVVTEFDTAHTQLDQTLSPTDVSISIGGGAPPPTTSTTSTSTEPTSSAPASTTPTSTTPTDTSTAGTSPTTTEPAPTTTEPAPTTTEPAPPPSEPAPPPSEPAPPPSEPPPPSGATVVPIDATGVITSGVVATEPAPAPPGPPACSTKPRSQYIFKMHYEDGRWKLVRLDVSYTLPKN